LARSWRQSWGCWCKLLGDLTAVGLDAHVAGGNGSWSHGYSWGSMDGSWGHGHGWGGVNGCWGSSNSWGTNDTGTIAKDTSAMPGLGLCFSLPLDDAVRVDSCGGSADL